MSLARQFGLEAPPRDLPARSDGLPFTSLAVSIQNRVQQKALQNAQNEPVSVRISRNNIPKLDTELKHGSDGSLSFTIYVDTESANKVVKTALVAKGFHFAKLSENRLLVVPRENITDQQIGFELTVVPASDSACTSKITFSAPQTYVALSVKDALTWSTKLKDLHHSIVFGCR